MQVNGRRLSPRCTIPHPSAEMARVRGAPPQCGCDYHVKCMVLLHRCRRNNRIHAGGVRRNALDDGERSNKGGSIYASRCGDFRHAGAFTLRTTSHFCTLSCVQESRRIYLSSSRKHKNPNRRTTPEVVQRSEGNTRVSERRSKAIMRMCAPPHRVNHSQ
jgi:hypothetical protein